ncbi:unnamed protein product [Heligmosomoides polygyrus]|uniref:PGM_PMM_I domain-containing protein n=1 Tax=Heligmosomoides polygyrus TaxID=6339 RepID=A0A183FIH6_HELPZ|nr:unnamed protein product [Heligmosomoides polygyrus]
MLRGDRLIWHDLGVCDKTSVAIFHKYEVNLRFGIPTVVSNDVGVAFPKHGVHNGEVMRLRILKDTLTIGYATHNRIHYGSCNRLSRRLRVH